MMDIYLAPIYEDSIKRKGGTSELQQRSPWYSVAFMGLQREFFSIHLMFRFPAEFSGVLLCSWCCWWIVVLIDGEHTWGEELLVHLGVTVTALSRCLSTVNLPLHFWHCSCSNWADWLHVGSHQSFRKQIHLHFSGSVLFYYFLKTFTSSWNDSKL